MVNLKDRRKHNLKLSASSSLSGTHHPSNNKPGVLLVTPCRGNRLLTRSVGNSRPFRLPIPHLSNNSPGNLTP